jgi:hypothetical protein
MEHIRWTCFVVLITVLALMIQLLITNAVMAQDPNTTSSQNPNNTELIVDLKNKTITLVDKITNETIGVKNLVPITAGNMTKNESLTADTANMTTNENLTAENTTINESLTTNAGNSTTSENLTDKFNALQGS